MFFSKLPVSFRFYLLWEFGSVSEGTSVGHFSWCAGETDMSGILRCSSAEGGFFHQRAATLSGCGHPSHLGSSCELTLAVCACVTGVWFKPLTLPRLTALWSHICVATAKAVRAKAQLFFFFNGTRVWTQGLTLARQALYLLSHSARPFLCWVFLR
jgi:hypothetical protein